MEDRGQPFAAFVLESLARQSTGLGRSWADHARMGAADSGEPNGSGSESRDRAERLIQTLLAAAADGVDRHELLIQASAAMGAEAHRRSISLQLMLKEVDILEALVLRAAEGIATACLPGATANEGLAVGRRITRAVSQLRLAAMAGYTQATEDELRERYRVIRHDLRNPLGTIKSAVALLTDESAPAEMRESRRVRAMVVRNTSSLDQMIGEALSDAAARLRAFDTAEEVPADMPANLSPELAVSAREQHDNVARPRQRSDLESGTL